MASDSPHASWHPALMPHSASNVEHLPPQEASSNTPEQPSEDVSQAISSFQDISEEALNRSVGPDAWFPQYDASGDQFLSQGSVAQEEASESRATPDAAAQEEGKATSSEKASKHLSTMSFARTVSHDVNWNDDDDADWSLPRTDSDPFSFMPTKDRTNSFPAVPTLQNSHDEVVDRPLPSNEAEVIIDEVERQEAREAAGTSLASAFQDNDDSFLDDSEVQDAFSQQQFIGGDVQGNSEEAADARFSEGLPLVSHEGDTETNDSLHVEAHGQEASATDPATDEDDFFSQVRGSATEETHGAELSPLERKSTMQVLDSLGLAKTASNMDSVDETLEEDEPLKESEQVQDDATKPETAEDLDTKWKEVFGEDDDEDLLLEDTPDGKEVDPAAFFGDDDEGFLDDVADETPAQPAEPAPGSVYSPTAAAPSPSVNGRYLPLGHSTPSTPRQTNPYLPSAQPLAVQSPALFSPPAQAPIPPMASALPYGAPPPRQELNKAQSFVDKKGGYQSPYDLPMEVVKPKKRVSMQNLQRTPATPHAPPPSAPPAPPRSASLYAQAPPPKTAGSVGSLSPTTPSQAAHPSPTKPPPPTSKQAFFEELPIIPKTRPAPRHNVDSRASPSQTSPYGPPPTSQLPPHVAPPPASQYPPPPPVQQAPQPPPGIPALVAPARVGPYTPLQSGSMPAPSIPPATSTRYSPAPPVAPHLNGMTSTAPPSRYSPAPPSSRPPVAGYGASGVASAPPVLPHQPRTSSPLAHFEVSHDHSRIAGHADSSSADRRGSSTYEQRVQRVPSLPPTREVEEEESTAQTKPPGQALTSPPPIGSAEQKYAQPPHRPRQTPPPSALSLQASLSPPKRATSNYSPARNGAAQGFVPPQRSQTQSPGALYGSRAGPNTVEHVQRPSSVHEPTSPRATAPPAATFQQRVASTATSTTSTRQRGFSQHLNLVPPTDGREHDPLQRWKGVPIFTWSVGGTAVTMFPKDVPRYGMNQSVPMVVRSPGEVKLKHIKDIEPLEERLAKFPGPLKGKSKKKETLTWLTAGIETLEANLPRNLAFQHHTSHEDKRAEERVLLWKILRLLVEHDGVLDGNPDVEQAVREVLSPKLGAQGLGSPLLTTGANMASLATVTQMHSDAIDPSSIEELRNYLLRGDREKAVWAAADKRLWGHAMLIANTVSQDMYKKVTQEFIKKEVNSPGRNNESLAALYEVLSGNHEDCVDELVPVHARAGLQLLAKDSSIGATKDVTEGLDKWRETLSLVLSNRSADDTRAMASLGNLLSGYGRAEAAHTCFIFARNHALFGGLDDPSSNFVLVGSDHRRQADQFAKETEPLLLSEVYEYGLSLSNSSNVPVNSPHLAAYKYQHALTLAEYGFKDKALQYCDAILNAMSSQTRRSPYHHPILEAAVEDLSKRLKLAPKEGSNSWIPKPSMNKVSDSVWNRFNKFVSGDDNEDSGQGSPTHGAESGPFARLASGTPTISRPPSSAGLETFGATVPGYPMANAPAAPVMPPAPAGRAASRYAPTAAQAAPAAGNPYEPSAYAPRSSMERTSSELNRGSFELNRPSVEMQQPHHGNTYTPNSTYPPAPGVQQHNATTGLGLSSQSRESSYIPHSQPDSFTSQPPPAASAPPGYAPQAKIEPSPNGALYPSSAPAGADNITPEVTGYQPPSYGYEPPSFTSHEAHAASTTETKENGGYEAPSYQPYGYEPPSYEPDSQPTQDESDEESKPKQKKRGPMYDDDEDDLVVPKTREKSKEEKDRENAEMFRKVAEEEAKRAAEAKQQQTKKGWGLGGWFSGLKKESPEPAPGTPNKPIRAKLGEANSFYYDPEQKRWVNKNASAEDQKAKTATPPPPRAPSGGSTRSLSGTPPPPGGPTSHPEPMRASAPPGGPVAGPPRTPSLNSGPPPPAGAAAGADGGLAPGGSLAMMRSASNTSAASGPPSRPTTSMSNASSIEDLLGAAGPRAKGAPKKAKRGGRYVDVMAKPS